MEVYFGIEGDAVVKHTPMPEIGENIYKTEVVMTKEIFQECYKKWIEPQESEADFSQPKDIEHTVENFNKVLDNKLIKDAISYGQT